jgi:hypothetical protein
VVGYLGDYSIGPPLQWWEKPLEPLGIRYSMVLALVTAIGVVLHIRSLQYGKTLLAGTEYMVFLLLGLVWLSVATGEPTSGRYSVVDHPSVKFTKVVIFAMMLTHVVTTSRKLDVLMWAFTIGALILGYEAYITPRAQFIRGRLETVGGPDFRECNVLAAYLVAMLPLIGAQFLRSGWPGRAVCLLAGAFAVNGIVLTRSRGALLGLTAGVAVAGVFAPKKHRLKVIACLLVAVIGGWMLTDPQFWRRASTITREQEQYDISARSRLEVWWGSWQMLKAHPFGVGAGNFHQTIGAYAYGHVGRDAHNTFLRCACELGIQGIAVFGAIVAGSLWTVRGVMRRVRDLPQAHQERMLYACYGTLVSIFTLLGSSLTVTLLYLEGMWWILLLPVCLRRVEANLRTETALAPASEARSAAADRRARFRRLGRPAGPKLASPQGS